MTLTKSISSGKFASPAWVRPPGFPPSLSLGKGGRIQPFHPTRLAPICVNYVNCTTNMAIKAPSTGISAKVVFTRGLRLIY